MTLRIPHQAQQVSEDELHADAVIICLCICVKKNIELTESLQPCPSKHGQGSHCQSSGTRRTEGRRCMLSEGRGNIPPFRTLWRGSDTWGGKCTKRSYIWGEVWNLHPSAAQPTASRAIAFNSQNILTGADREGRELTHRDQVGYFAMVFMMEYMVAESHSSFMEVFAPASQTDITDEQYHEFRLELRRVKEANTHITQANFEEEDWTWSDEWRSKYSSSTTWRSRPGGSRVQGYC